MANIRSASKRARQAEKRTLRNKAAKTRIRSVTRQVLGEIQAGGAADAAVTLRTAMAIIDKAARKGIIHPNTAARKKSRLARRLNALQAE